MNRLRALALALCLVWAGGLSAETVRVLSGEHDGFTRLALVFEGPVGWRFGRAGGGYEVRVDRGGVDYDIARVFDLVPRTRLTGLGAADGRLRLSVAAGTRAVPFELRPGVVVIDIRDGAPDPAAAFEQTLDPVRAPDPAAWALGLDLLGLAPPLARPTMLPLRVGQPAIPPGPLRTAAAALAPIPPPGPDLDATRHLLAAQIARAAAQGLVEARDPGAVRLPTAGRPPAGGGGAAGARHVGAETSVDREMVPGPGGAAPGAHDRACATVGGVWTAITDLERDPLAALAEARAGVFDDRDRVSGADAVKRLVHANLALGFGAEARAALAAFPGVLPEGALLADIARIVDGDAVGPDSGLRAVGDCGDGGHLWAYLADPKAAPGPDRADALVRAVSALPGSLRAHLGPTVATALAAAGWRDAALAIRDALARPRAGRPGTGAIVEASLAAAADPAIEANLLATVAADGPDAPAALAAFVDGRIAAGLPVPPELALDAATFAREARGGPTGADRARTAVLARAASGDVAGALADLAAGAQAISAADTTAAAVFGLLADRTDDATFLSLALGWLAQPRGPAPAGAAAGAIAERLLALGFGAEAEALHARAGAAPDEAARFRARARLADGDPAGALRALAGLTGDDADALRAAALEGLGDYRGAALAWQRAGVPAEATRAAFAAGDWRAVIAAGSDVADDRVPILERLTAAQPGAAAAGPSPAVPEAVASGAAETDAGVLAQARALAEAARAMRADIAKLRESLPPLPPTGPATTGTEG